jgi:hypothetical protein
MRAEEPYMVEIMYIHTEKEWEQRNPIEWRSFLIV